MGIIYISVGEVGQVDQHPIRAKLVTTDSLAVVTAAGYLNNNVLPGPISAIDFFDVCYSYSAVSKTGTMAVMTVAISASGVITLSLDVNEGNVLLPVVANHIAAFTGTSGQITGDLATIINGGNIQAGLSGTAGYLASFPSASAKGSLRITGVANTGDTVTTVSNSAMGQASVISIPDPGASTANFLLNTGAANIIAKQEFLGINDILAFSAGTWTTTRIAQGNYVSRHTAADDTAIIGIDITPAIVVAASKGFRLDSFDVIYSIGTLAMDAHSATLDRIAYANNVAVSVTSIPITATLATATQANPYVTNCTVTTPAFDITADSKYVLEITANNSATSAYDFYGVMLRFSQTIA